MGFRMSGKISNSLGGGSILQRTRNCPACTTASKVIDYGCVALDSAVYGEVGAVAGVGDLLVFQNSQCCHNSLGG